MDGVFVIDAAGTVVQANAAASRLTGHALEQLIGRPIATLISDDQATIRSALRDDGPLRRDESWLVPKSGVLIPVSLTAAAIGDNGIVVVARDCSAANRIRDEEIAKREAAERELRALKAATADRVERARALERRMLTSAIARAATDPTLLDQLVRKLRVKPDAGRTVELNRVITDIVFGVESTGRLRGSEVVFVLHNEPVFVSASRVRIEQILANLVCNAAEAFGKQPGKVLVATRLDGTRTRALVEVTDDGPGMPAEVVARATEPLFTTKPDALGLGLSVARELVESYGGALRLESTLGLGATATFDLPVARAS